MAKYRISVSFDEKNFFWIVVYNGKIIRNPTEEDLEGTKLKIYNKTNICPRCREEKERDGKELINEGILHPKNALQEIDKNGKNTGEWVCKLHYSRSYNHCPNSTNSLIKSLRDRRTGNLDPDCNSAKGDGGEDLLCEWKGYTNLNKKYDNYTFRIDCFDEETKLYYQAKVAWYNRVNRLWSQNFIDEHKSIGEGFRFNTVYIFCISRDGKVVERIYEIPEDEVIKRKSISIYKNPSKGIRWYEQYRAKDEEELKKVNEIWKRIRHIDF